MFLYLRMIINIIISLYTSRVVLSTLGIVDYGIYNVVGSTVAIVGFLSSTMSSSTSRFLSIALTKRQVENISLVFKTAYTLHLILAAIILILGESIGLWFVNNVLVYPREQTFATNCIYQFSLLATCISITQLPYDALLIAYEDIKIFAYFQILSSVLKLSIALSLLLIADNRLIVYGALVFFVGIIMFALYYIYCNHNYKDCAPGFCMDKGCVKEIASFSGWDILGHLGFTTRQQGTNILLNYFFGAAVNAASGIATTIQGVISQFSYNITTAARPQIIKFYSTNNHEMYRKSMTNVATLSIVMMLTVTIPLIINLRPILTLWLGNVPEYCYQFTLYCLICGLISSISSVYLIGIHATGDIKVSSIGRNITYICSLIVIYLLLKFGYNPTWAYIITAFVQFVTLLIDGVILNKSLSISVQCIILFKCTAVVFLSLISGYIGVKLMICSNEICNIILSTISYISVFFSLVSLTVLSREQRHIIYNRLMTLKSK